MQKSIYGKELAFFWTGSTTPEQLSLREVASTLKICEEEEQRINVAFEEAKKKNPNFFDGTLWRYEGHQNLRGGVEFLLSPTNYMPHNILRHEQSPISYENGRFVSKYPNPFSVNAFQVTADGYLLVGVKGIKSDQQGLGVMGAGFVKRETDRGKNLPPKNLFRVTLRECLEETDYLNDTAPTETDMEKFRVLGMIFGSNHDTTACVYVPLKATRKEVEIGNLEHSDLLFLPVQERSSLVKFLNDGGMKGIPAVDHLLGCVELYSEL